MLQCHFLSSVLSKHFVSYLIFRSTHLVFHSQLRAICRTRLQCSAERPKSLLVCHALGMRAMVRYLLEYYASRWKTK